MEETFLVEMYFIYASILKCIKGLNYKFQPNLKSFFTVLKAKISIDLLLLFQGVRNVLESCRSIATCFLLLI